VISLKRCCACRLIVSIAWVAHIVIYLLIDPPLSSFLNEVFIKLDGVWGIFWSSILVNLCCWLEQSNSSSDLCTRSPWDCCFRVLLLLSPYCSDCWGDDAWFETCFHHNSPDEVTSSYLGLLFFSAVLLIINLINTNKSICFRWGGTLMNSFLFNVGLILLCSIRYAINAFLTYELLKGSIFIFTEHYRVMDIYYISAAWFVSSPQQLKPNFITKHAWFVSEIVFKLSFCKTIVVS